ncbi:MAG TPA: fibronectin type III domain-containing protein, partial [Thermoanaerobaculia bacterium]|nr:fibronectin type III domain-containing protein [Thermoanaerobaculia bacterium]
TGVIEFVYRNMTMSAGGAADANSRDPHIGFSFGNTAGSVGSVTAAQSGVPAPSFNGASATPVANLYTAGAITVLTSAAQGSRRIFTFTPPTPAAPTGLSFTGVTKIATTLNWTDSANELGYAIYRSTDGGTTFVFDGTAVQNATSYNATGLLPGTTYTWAVDAVSEGALSALTGSQATLPPGNVTSTGAGGNWSAPATWGGGMVPGAGDHVTIANGSTVTIDTAAAAYSLTVGQGSSGTLQYDGAAARSLTVGTSVTIANGGTFQTDAAGTFTHTLTLPGNLTNNGTLDFHRVGLMSNFGTGIVFTGSADQIFSGTGPTTDILSLTVNKGGSMTPVLELMPTNFSVRGVTNDSAGAGWLVMTNGTFKLSGAFAGTNRTFATAAYTIPATFRFWLNNPNYTVAGQNGSPTNNGALRVSQGVFNIVSVADNAMGAGIYASFVIEGGTVNVSGRLYSANVVSYSQSGGTVNICTVGNTASLTPSFRPGVDGTFIMSGGTINLVQINSNATAANRRDYDVYSVIQAITGGTLNVGTGATTGNAGNFDFRIIGYTPDFVIDNTANGKKVIVASDMVTPGNIGLIIRGNTTIKPGATLSVNGYIALVEGSTFTNDGTLDGTAALTQFAFDGTSPQIYTGSGVTTPALNSFECSNVAGLTLTSTNQVLTNRVVLQEGSITNSGKITLGSGGATTASVQIGYVAPLAAGSFDAPFTFNLGSGGQTVSYLRTTSSRSTGPEINPTRILNRLEYADTDPTHTLTIAGGDLTMTSTAASPNNALALTNGRVITGSNTLILNNAASVVTRTTGLVDGNLRKAYSAAANKTFEVGTANGYSPVAINVTGGSLPANVTVKATQTVAPGLNPTLALARYWTLTATGITADLTFNYLDPTDIPGTANESNFKLYRHDMGGFTDVMGTVTTAANTATKSGVTMFSDWSLAEPSALNASATVSGSATICPGSMTTIQAALSGTPPWNITWSDAVMQNGVTMTPATRTVGPAVTTVYT